LTRRAANTKPLTLRKLQGPTLKPNSLPNFDYILLSHDHHFDNLDHAGRVLIAQAKKVLTTEEGTKRLGGNAVGLAHWQATQLIAPSTPFLHLATSARHGPSRLDRGAVNGFVLTLGDANERAIYLFSDTVWYEDIADIARRFDVPVAILYLGAARVPEVGPFHLTMTAQEAVEAVRCFKNAMMCLYTLRIGRISPKDDRRLVVRSAMPNWTVAFSGQDAAAPCD
jgi:L-ascorbate metabolism protein UlaG (beta-lactamase superfamily)